MLTIDIQKKRGDFLLNIQHTFLAPYVGVFGASGSGKSTLLHLISGLLTPDQGTISLDQALLFDTKHNCPTQLRNIGYVRQEALLFPHLSVHENLTFALHHTRSTNIQFSIEQIIEEFSLQPFLLRKPHTLSGGEKQRVALARALLASPKLLLLDEPMVSLDEDTAQEILMLLLQYKHTIPLIYVSHNKERMKQLADEVIILEKGNLSSPLQQNTLDPRTTNKEI
jgi:molybdate transport system ATP-binding protein